MKRKEKLASETGFEGWGDYMDAKISKLEEQFRHNAANVELKLSNLFEGISIFVNGYTKPSAEELKRLMMQHGGTFHHYKRPTTTYVIASNLPDVKVKSITSEIIIGPQWVVDCIEQNKIVDYKPYLLYTNHKPSQPKLAFGRLDKQEDLRKPVIKPEGKDDINKDEFMNLMSKLHVLNEQMKAGEQPTPKVEESANSDLDSTAKLEEQILAGSPEVFENEVQDQPPPEPSPIKHVEPEPEAKKSDTRTALVATDPNFLPEFFFHSRLHHIATLGSGFKQYVSKLRESHDGKFPARDTLAQEIGIKPDEFLPQQGSFIMHIDMDCFFVSVGLRKYPELRGQPVAVTHSKGSEAGTMQARPGQDRAKEIELYQKRLEERYKTPDIPYESRLLNITDNNSMSEIASCSYEARQKGVKNGMFVGSALKLCPELKTIPYDFEGYKEVAFTLYNTVAKYTLNIEAVSCDEMFVDLTELISSIPGLAVMDFITFLRAEIQSTTGCPCSAGVGANRLQARMATKRAKPNGQFYLGPEEVEQYMKDIAIGDLPGIGPSTSYRLRQMGFEKCGDLQGVAGGILQREFGKKFGDMIYSACRGIDERGLVYDKVRKSVSVDVNYGIRFKEDGEVERFMKQLCEEIHKRLCEIRQRGKLVTVKLLVRSPEAPVETAKYMGHGLCDVITKSQPLKEYSCDLEVIQRAVLSLMKQIAAPPHELRGIGLQISKFEEKKSHVETKNSLKSLFQKVEAKNATAPKKEPSPVKLELTPRKLEVTPTKVTSPSTPKASPRRTESKAKPQPPKFGRGRGRPPKYLSLNKSKQSNDMIKFLKDAAAGPSRDSEPIPEGLDPEVLAALPEDIRAEVIKDYKFQAKQQKTTAVPKIEKTSPKPSTSVVPAAAAPTPQPDKICVDFKFLQALPAELRAEVERQIELQKDTMVITSSEPEFDERLQVTPEPSPVKTERSVPEVVQEDEKVVEEEEEDNVLLRPNWRQLLTAWVESADEPEQVDVEMIAAGACELIRRKMLYELQQAIRLLCRVIGEREVQGGEGGWHVAYGEIVEQVQAVMVGEYGTKLAVPNGFEGCNVKGGDR